MLAAGLTTPSSLTLLAALLGLSALPLLTAHLLTTLLIAHLLAILLTAPRLWRTLVSGFAAVLQVRLSDGVGFEAALSALLTTALALRSLLAAAIRPLRTALSTARFLTISLPARSLAVPLAAVRPLAAAGLLAAALSPVAAVGTAPASRFAGRTGVLFAAVPLVRAASSGPVGAALVAAAAAVQSVEPAAVVVVASPLGLAIPIGSLAFVRAVGTSVSRSVAVVSVVHGGVVQ